MSLESTPGLELVKQRLGDDRHLAVLITTRPGRSDPQVAVVNAAAIAHPTSAAPVIALVARRGAKLANLRRHRFATVVVRAGWDWVAASGPVELLGPDDTHSLDEEAQRTLLRTIYLSAGGSHPDLSIYDQVMLDERRCAVLIQPTRIWTNPLGSEHLEAQDQ